MLLAVLLGAVIGLLMGALGGGGAILAVPALVFIFGFEPQDATLGSLVVMVAGTVSGIVNHAKMGSVDLSKGVLFGVLGIAGTYVGRYLAGGVNGNSLMLTFAALLVVVASLMIKNAATGSQAVSGDRGTGGLMGVIKTILAALLVGVLVGFFGVGGGFMIVPTLTLLMGLSMRHAVGTSLVVIFINSVAGLGAGFAQLNQLDWGGAECYGRLGCTCGAHRNQNRCQAASENAQASFCHPALPCSYLHCYQQFSSHHLITTSKE